MFCVSGVFRLVKGRKKVLSLFHVLDGEVTVLTNFLLDTRLKSPPRRRRFYRGRHWWLRSPPSFQSQRSQRNVFSATCGFELRDHLCKEMNLVSFILFVCSRNFACFSTCWGRLRKLFQIDHQPVVHFSLPFPRRIAMSFCDLHTTRPQGWSHAIASDTAMR